MATRFDVRTLADLASDSGEPIADVTDDPNILAALEDASGRMDAAALRGKLYTPTQLGALTGNSLALRKRICCEIALAYLMARRPEKYGAESLKGMMESSEAYLEMLRKGDRLFEVDALIEAGLPEIDGPTTAQYNDMNLLPERTRNFYPSRASRVPIGRG
jgi:phage gp36-like protein